VEERRRVLLVVGTAEEPALRSLFAREALAGWEATVSTSFEKAHFVVQHGPCDVLVVDESLLARHGTDGLGWLARQRDAPTVLLANVSADLWARAYEHGVGTCLPRHSASSTRCCWPSPCAGPARAGSCCAASGRREPRSSSAAARSTASWS
jgi:hypothetical protein